MEFLVPKVKDKNELYRIDGSFRDREEELLYMNCRWNAEALRMRIVALLTGSAYLAGIFSDVFTLGGTEGLKYMVIARLITFTAAIATAFTTFGKNKAVLMQRVLFVYMMIITASECLELLLNPVVG